MLPFVRFSPVLAAVTLSLTALGQSSAGPAHVMPTRGQVAAADAITPQSTVLTGGPTYHGGPVMHVANVYFIWYGNWAGDTSTTILPQLINGLDNSPYFATNTSYTDAKGRATGSPRFAGSTTDAYSHGKALASSAPGAILSTAISLRHVPSDPNGIYFIMTSKDVSLPGFCTQFCGWHTWETVGANTLKYAYVGHPDRCPQPCGENTPSPNANPAADAMASIVTHELEETVTDPLLNAWSSTGRGENGDACAWNFGPEFKTATGARANMRLGARDFFIQQDWLNLGSGRGVCVQSLHPHPVPEVFSPADGYWSNSISAVQYGQAGDIPVPADYNGDHLTDLAMFRPSTGTWYLQGVTSLVYGQAGDIPVPSDYTGGGSAQTAVWRPSNGTWYIRGVETVQYGSSADVPVPADYNGAGKADLAVWRPSTGTWYIRGQATVQWGRPGDIPVPADYNGDGKADLAVYRPSTGTWYIRNQATIPYGAPGDLPLPGDFNGNGHVDLAVYRPSTFDWYVRGAFTNVLGYGGVVPAASPLNRLLLAQEGLAVLPPPVLTCPDVTAAATSASGAPVSFPGLTVTDVYAPPTLSYSSAPGSEFPVGVTPVTVQAKGVYAESAQCTFNVTVTPFTGASVSAALLR